MWICENCKEENEDNFDTCWSCQSYFEHRASEADKHQLKINKDDEINRRNDSDEMKIIGELKKKFFQVLGVTALAYLLGWSVLHLITGYSVKNAFVSVVFAIIVRRFFKGYLRKKIVDELKKEKINHK